jgi:hypothetical protein
MIPHFADALKFVSRCQNFSETNNQPWAGDDGGFIYTPANGGNSAAGEYTAIGGRRMLRSYGSMTYAGLKSMIYAGLSHDDPRVKAAWDWISKNFTVDENPGMSASGPENAQGGLYYYFYTMDRSLTAYGQPVIVDPQGKHHDWRLALIDKLATLQRPDGSFAGSANGWRTIPCWSQPTRVMFSKEPKRIWPPSRRIKQASSKRKQEIFVDKFIVPNFHVILIHFPLAMLGAGRGHRAFQFHLAAQHLSPRGTMDDSDRNARRRSRRHQRVICASGCHGPRQRI